MTNITKSHQINSAIDFSKKYVGFRNRRSNLIKHVIFFYKSRLELSFSDISLDKISFVDGMEPFDDPKYMPP